MLETDTTVVIYSLESTVGCFPELCFLQFSVAQVFVGLRKKIINDCAFPSWACAAVFNNNYSKYFKWYTLICTWLREIL